MSEAWVDFSIVLFRDQVMVAVGVVDGLMLEFLTLELRALLDFGG